MKDRNVLSVFKDPRKLVFCAALAAFSAVFGKFLSINIGDSIRFSFENLTIILSGYLFGPVAGAAVGFIADLLGCLIKGFAINPLITLCAMLVGAVAGAVSLLFTFIKTGKDITTLKVYAAVFSAHIIGNMILKSLALRYSYGTPFQVLILRVPIYSVTALIEETIIVLLLHSRAFTSLLYNER